MSPSRFVAELEDFEIEAPALKHGDHDQSTHAPKGSRASAPPGLAMHGFTGGKMVEGTSLYETTYKKVAITVDTGYYDPEATDYACQSVREGIDSLGDDVAFGKVMIGPEAAALTNIPSDAYYSSIAATNVWAPGVPVVVNTTMMSAFKAEAKDPNFSIAHGTKVGGDIMIHENGHAKYERAFMHKAGRMSGDEINAVQDTVEKHGRTVYGRSDPSEFLAEAYAEKFIMGSVGPEIAGAFTALTGMEL